MNGESATIPSPPIVSLWMQLNGSMSGMWSAASGHRLMRR